jgi:hypothetical protein
MRARPRVDEPEGPSTAPCRRLAPATPWLPLQVCSNRKSNQSNQQPPEPTKRPTKSLIASDPIAETRTYLPNQRIELWVRIEATRKKREGIRGGAMGDFGSGSKTYRGRKGRSLDERKRICSWWPPASFCIAPSRRLAASFAFTRGRPTGTTVDDGQVKVPGGATRTLPRPLNWIFG